MEFLRVPLDLQTVFTPNGRHTLSILSLSPGIYGSCRSLGAGWLVCEELAGVGRALGWALGGLLLFIRVAPC